MSNNDTNPEENNNNHETNGNTLKRTHSESQETDLKNENNPQQNTENIDPKIENNGDAAQEPPAKRMKIASPQIPHYNSHNIYHRPPAPPSSMPIPSLPAIVDPVTASMLFNDDDNKNNNNNFEEDDMMNGVSAAPLPEPTEEWPLCAYCNKGGDLSRCSSCRQSYYCNRDCQVSHWEVHSIICQPGPPQPPQLPSGPAVQPPICQPAPPRPQQPYYDENANMQPPFANGGGPGGYTENYAPPQPPKPRRRTSSYRSSSDNVGKEQYYCEECDRYFKNGQALGGHRSRVHSSRRGNNDPSNGPTPRRKPRPSRGRYDVNGTGQYVCPHCGREFASGNALGGHISGAHTKKSKRMARERADSYGNGGYNQRPPTSKYVNPVAM